MTLFIVANTKRLIYVSSDFRLSGTKVEESNGTKQITVLAVKWTCQISFTGIARIGYGYNTRTWLQQAANSMSSDATIDQFVNALTEKGTAVLSDLAIKDKRLTIVAAFAAFGECRLFVLSNWESPRPPAPNDMGQLHFYEVISSIPRVFVFGDHKTLPRFLVRRIRRLVRNGATRDEVWSALALANKTAANQSNGTISSGCWVHSFSADGKSSGKNYGAVQGRVCVGMPGGFDWLKMFNEIPGVKSKNLTMLVSATAIGSGISIPKEIGPPRTLSILCPTSQWPITLKAGSASIGTFAILGSEQDIVVCKNQFEFTSLATITLDADFSALKSLKPFKAKHHSLSCIPTIDGVQPRTWSYSIDVQFDGEAFEVKVFPNSVGLRSVNAPVAFSQLGATEELNMMAPADVFTLCVSSQSPQTSAPLQARFLLQDFPELEAL